MHLYLGISKLCPIPLVERWMSFTVTTGTSLVMSYFLYKLHTSTVRVVLGHAHTFRLIGSLAYHILIVHTSIGVADKPQGVPGFIDVHPHWDATRKCFKSWATRVLVGKSYRFCFNGLRVLTIWFTKYVDAPQTSYSLPINNQQSPSPSGETLSVAEADSIVFCKFLCCCRSPNRCLHLFSLLIRRHISSPRTSINGWRDGLQDWAHWRNRYQCNSSFREWHWQHWAYPTNPKCGQQCHHT